MIIKWLPHLHTIRFRLGSSNLFFFPLLEPIFWIIDVVAESTEELHKNIIKACAVCPGGPDCWYAPHNTASSLYCTKSSWIRPLWRSPTPHRQCDGRIREVFLKGDTWWAVRKSRTWGQERTFLLLGQLMYFLLNIESPTTVQATDDQ